MVAIKAHFDGKVIVPDQPVNLPQDTSLLIHVAPVIPEGTPGSRYLALAGTIDPDDLRVMSGAIEEGCERIDNE